jgi:hypothetical protein
MIRQIEAERKEKDRDTLRKYIRKHNRRARSWWGRLIRYPAAPEERKAHEDS